MADATMRMGEGLIPCVARLRHRVDILSFATDSDTNPPSWTGKRNFEAFRVTLDGSKDFSTGPRNSRPLSRIFDGSREILAAQKFSGRLRIWRDASDFPGTPKSFSEPVKVTIDASK